MLSAANNTEARKVLAAASRLAARSAICAYPWQVGTAGIDHPKHGLEMTADVFKTHHRWPGDPSS